MSLDPQLKAYLDALEELGAPPLNSVPVDVARKMYEKGAEQTRGTPPEPMAIDELLIPGPESEL